MAQPWCARAHAVHQVFPCPDVILEIRGFRCGHPAARTDLNGARGIFEYGAQPLGERVSVLGIGYQDEVFTVNELVPAGLLAMDLAREHQACPAREDFPRYNR